MQEVQMEHQHQRLLHEGQFEANLISLGFLVPLSLSVSERSSVCTIFAQNSSSFDFPSVFVNMFAGLKFCCLFHKSQVFRCCTFFKPQHPRLCEGCFCQFLCSRQLLSHSKNLHAVLIASFANPILSIFLRECVMLTSCSTETNHVLYVELCLSKCRPRPRDHSRRVSTRYRVSSPVTVHVHLQVCSAWYSCVVYCCAFFGTPFKCATRFNGIM